MKKDYILHRKKKKKRMKNDGKLKKSIQTKCNLKMTKK